MIRVFIIIYFIALGAVVTYGQKKEIRLIGTWERVEEVNKEPQIIIGGNNNNEKIEVLLSFKDETNIKIKQGKRVYEAKYQIEANDLTLGNRKYQIIKLDSDSLIMKESSDFLPQTYKYFRTTKTIKE
ncbi:hypothetical protein ACXR6G_05565 [Ancylomarina sp. YFZ004]